MKQNQVNWGYLARGSFLLLVCAYVILVGGGFSALVDFNIQAFSTVLASLVFGAWLIARIIGKKKLPGTGIDWVIFLFLASQLIAVIFSEDPRRSLQHATLWLIYTLVLYFVLDLIRSSWRESPITRNLLIAGSVLLVFAILDLGRTWQEWRELTAGLEFIPSFQQRLGTIVGDPNLLAAVTNLLIPLALAGFLVSKQRLEQMALAIFLIASVIVVYFTDSRGGLLGLGGSTLVLGVLWVLLVSEKAKARIGQMSGWLWGRKFYLLGVVAALVGVIAFVGWQFLSFEGDTTHAPVSEARDIYWDAAIDAVQADPLTGAGPGLYPIYLMKIWSTPPARPYLHAHSFPFQVAAESGLLGLGALLFLLAAIVWRAWKGWKDLPKESRVWWAAAVSGLVGLVAHSMVDDFFPFPAVGVIAFVYLAFVLSPEPDKQKKLGLSPWVLAALGLAAAVFALHSLNAYWHANKAISFGSQGDWVAAAIEMEIAANADPNFAFYWLQTGYSYGRVAEMEPDYLHKAISAYDNGIQIEPEYALSRANYAAILWQKGDQGEALRQMRIATSLAPESWLILLNHGAFEEELGLSSKAMSSYSLAIKSRPGLIGAKFWNGSDLRIDITQVAIETKLPYDPRDEAQTLVLQAREMVRTLDFDAAHSLFAEAYSLYDQEVMLYVGLAELAFAKTNLELAEKYVQIALWIPATNNQSKVEAILLGAEISRVSGDNEEALQRYEIAYKAIFAETSYGWGSFGWSPYAWFIFQRQAFPEDLLPQLERADITIDIAQRLMPIADLYQEVGEIEKAQEVRETIEPYLP